MKKNGILILTCAITILPNIKWDKDHPLTWADYKVNAIDSEEFAAVTTHRIEIEYGKWSSENTYVVLSSVFIGEESWVKLKYANSYLLNHEQKHFDLTEFHARKLRKIVQSKIYSNYIEMYQSINILLDSIRIQNTLEQSLYDKETEHCRNIINQNKWDKYIDSSLVSLEEYTLDTIYVTFLTK